MPLGSDEAATMEVDSPEVSLLCDGAVVTEVARQVAGPLRVVYSRDQPVAAHPLRDCTRPIPTENTGNNKQKRKGNEIRSVEMCRMQEDTSLCQL